MFTWICPQCGREVPPAYTECPDCNPPEGAKPPAPPAADVMSPSGPVAAPPPPEPTPVAPPPPAAPATPPAPAPAPPPPAYTTTPPNATPRNSAIFNTQSAPVQRRPGLPTWLMALLFAGGFVVVGLGIYWLVSSKSNSTAVALSKPSANAESPAAKSGVMHPLQKHIEIAGVRFVESGKNKKNAIAVAFLVINHSNLDIDGLSGNVTLWSNTRRSDEDAQGNFSFTTDIKANSARELTVPLNTTKQAVELPDWQYLSPDVQITGPAFAGGSVVQK